MSIPTSITHSRIDSDWFAQAGGGMSAAWAMYTHGGFWGPTLNYVTASKNYFRTSTDALTCMYGGYSTDSGSGQPNNIRVTDNTFEVGCGSSNYINGWRRAADGGTNNVWSGNRLSNGTTLVEPSSNTYGWTGPMSPLRPWERLPLWRHGDRRGLGRVWAQTFYVPFVGGR